MAMNQQLTYYFGYTMDRQLKDFNTEVEAISGYISHDAGTEALVDTT